MRMNTMYVAETGAAIVPDVVPRTLVDDRGIFPPAAPGFPIVPILAAATSSMNGVWTGFRDPAKMITAMFRH